MEQFISLIIFSLPGLLTYFWLEMFGLTPAIKRTVTEMVGLIALLWAPTTFLTIIIYNLLYIILDSFFKSLEVDLSSLNLDIVNNLADLTLLSTNLIFLFYYLILSIIFSFMAGFVWTVYLFPKTLLIINFVRKKRNIIKLSVEPSVWESFFYKVENSQEDQLLVEFYKIDKPDYKIVGPVIRMSRSLEAEKSLVIDTSKGWQEAHQHLEYSIKRTYFDTKTGTIINELDVTKPAEKIVTVT